MAYVGHDRLHGRTSGGDIDGGTGQHTVQRRPVWTGSPEVKTRQHVGSLVANDETFAGHLVPTYARQVTSGEPAAAGRTHLALFPLGTVLFPGLVMPLHVFEERYRTLVRHIMEQPDGTPREFGVVAIQRGWEVNDSSGTVTLYEVGCTAEVRQITEHPDGRFDLVTVGRRRFEITEILTSGTPYLQANVRYLPEAEGSEGDADLLGPRVLAAFRVYLGLVRTDSADLAEQLPDDPHVLSHLVAATASLTVADRQRLLATPDTASRLRAELKLLHREIGLLRQVRAVPMALSELPVKPGPN
jgi:Lon protease-like protein